VWKVFWQLDSRDVSEKEEAPGSGRAKLRGGDIRYEKEKKRRETPKKERERERENDTFGKVLAMVFISFMISPETLSMSCLRRST
jgi:hypothetical protein